MINSYDKLVWARGVTFVQVDNGLLICDSERKSFWAIHDVAVKIWKMLDGNHSVDDIADAISRERNIDKQTARASCFKFIEQLMNRKFITTKDSTAEVENEKQDVFSSDLEDLLKLHYGIENVTSIIPQHVISGRSRRYRIETSQGDYILREYDSIHYEQSIQFEHSTLDHLSEMNLGITIQKALLLRESHKSYFCLKTSDYCRFYSLFEFVPGNVWNWDPKNPDLSKVQDLAKIVARIQASLQGFRPEGKRNTLIEDLKSWDRIYDRFKLELEGDYLAVFSTFFPYFYRKREELIALFSDQNCNIVAHTDIRPRNIILNENGKISGIIDFDKCSFFIRTLDMATSMAVLALHPKNASSNFEFEFDERIATTFLDAYQNSCIDCDMSRLGEEELRLIVPCIQLNILRGVNFVIIAGAPLSQKMKSMEMIGRQIEFFDSSKKEIETCLFRRGCNY